MEYSRFLDCLAADFAPLRAVVAADLSGGVPSCPGSTVADLTRHVGEVYLHKTLAMREGAEPEPWPPKELADEEPLALFDRAYAGLLGEFAARKPADPAGSWYTPDQTVGFWIRRMAQETVIHRIGELLKVFVSYSVAGWATTSPASWTARRAGPTRCAPTAGHGGYGPARGCSPSRTVPGRSRQEDGEWNHVVV
jgi:Mycothiol maleylpyruvate isomerase N-terminal domain